MNVQLPPPITETPSAPPALPQPVSPPAQPPNAAPPLALRILFAPIKFLLGMVFCQSVPGSLLVIGWTYRLVQRAALRRWWEATGQPDVGWLAFVAGDARTAEHAHWPNWILAQNFRPAAREHFFQSLGSSLWQNAKLGVQGIFNTWTLTLPGCALILFAWYDGWNNSFNKGYEQAFVAPITGWAGIFMFIAAMFYVPMAQARQAVTGNWRSFYDFRLVWNLVRRRWLSCLGLAALYSLLSLPLMALASAVQFLPQINPRLADATPEQVRQILGGYFFWAGAFVLPAFVLVRLAAARIYSGAILRAVQRGVVPESALSGTEWHALNRLGLLHAQPAPARHPLVRIAAWTATRAGRITAGFVTALIWFTFLAQTFVQQFMNYAGGFAWLNQPLAQLPRFHYVPARLESPWVEVLVAALVILVAWLVSLAVKAARGK
jgi:hypothetical protein